MTNISDATKEYQSIFNGRMRRRVSLAYMYVLIFKGVSEFVIGTVLQCVLICMGGGSTSFPPIAV